MLTICFVRRGFEGMIGPRLHPVLPISMSQRIEYTNLVRCKLNLKLGGGGGGGGCVACVSKRSVPVCLCGFRFNNPTFEHQLTRDLLAGSKR